MPDSQPNREAQLSSMLRELRLSTMASSYANLALKASKEHLTHEGFLYELVRLECEVREQRRIERHLIQSKLPRGKTFGIYSLDQLPAPLRLQVERLRTGEFVNQAHNVIAVGIPGVGKSHLAAALGHELIAKGYTVFWTSTSTLVQRLLAAKRALRLPQELARLQQIHCLILDDIGYVQQDREEMEVLFTLLAERYEQRSVLITTNFVFSEWDKIFKDPMTTLAAVDRVVHHSVILDMTGMESYRATQARQERLALATANQKGQASEEDASK
jgi:DNA replication protein DnaC